MAKKIKPLKRCPLFTTIILVGHSATLFNTITSLISQHFSKIRPTMAAAAASTVAGLCTSLPSAARATASPKAILVNGFVKSPVAPRNPLKIARASGGRATCSGKFIGDWLRTDLNVIGFGFIGWLAPSSVPAIDGKSLTGLFFDSIGTELAHFPTPPAVSSQFWLWLVTWHLGLFLCLTFGQIGFKGRSEEYF